MQPIQIILETLRFTPILLILIYAAITDHKTGHVPNYTWTYLPGGAILTAIITAAYPELIKATIFSIALAIGLSLVFFYFNMWGGADSKALILIGVSTPLSPIVFGTPIMLAPYILVIAGITAIAVTAYKKPKDFLHTKIRYMPYILIGYVASIILSILY